MKQRPLWLGLAAYTALWAGLWWSERQARGVAEAERDRVASAVPGKGVARAPIATPAAGEAPSGSDSVPEDTPDTGAAPPAGGEDGTRVPEGAEGSGDGAPAGGGAEGPATGAAAGSAPSSEDEAELEVDPTRPLEEVDRLLPLLRRRVGLPIGARGTRDRELILRTLGKLLDAAPQEVENRLAEALRVEEHFGLFRQIADLLHTVNPERVTQVVREMTESTVARERENAVAALGLFADDEAELLWRRMAADPDPTVRQTAIGYPPRQDPAFDVVVREVVTREGDPVQRGESMHALFSARPTQENLDFLLREVKLSPDPAFRTAALAWFGWELTVRDGDAIRQLRELAGPAGGDPAVRRRAAEILLSGGQRKQGLVPTAERARWEAVLVEIDAGK